MRLKNLVLGLIVGLVVASLGSMAAAALKLPAVIGDNMVLQQGQPVPIWGWTDKDAAVTVAFAGQTATATADAQGRWKVELKKLAAGGPHTMTIKSGKENRTLKNVLVGEVWVCSGQSNMEMGIEMAKDAQKEVAAADYPQIRLFTVDKSTASEPLNDCKQFRPWAECSPKSITNGAWGGFSAAAYYFGRELHKQLGVPVGLIHTSWGGTPAEAWTSRKALEAEPKLKGLGGSGLYNGMIAPLIPYGIRGAIWYQGEANVGRAYQYRTLLPTMIANWRSDWKQGDFPFLIVQIAPYHYNRPGKDGRFDPRRLEPCAELWEAELLTHKTVANTGLAVTTDIGDLNDIHPKNKQEVGRRLALWALAKTYGRDVVCSGPLYKSMSADGNGRIHLAFDYAAGLKSSDGKPLSCFTICGADHKFLPAEARIDGNSVVVISDEIMNPVAVRFAWREDAQPNLVNGAGLPASPFRTDSFKGVTQP